MIFTKTDQSIRFEGKLADQDGNPTNEAAAAELFLPEVGDETSPVVVNLYRTDLSTVWATKTFQGDSSLQSLHIGISFCLGFLASYS